MVLAGQETEAFRISGILEVACAAQQTDKERKRIRERWDGERSGLLGMLIVTYW